MKINMNAKSVIFRINENGEGLNIVRNVCLEKGWLEYDEDKHEETEWNIWWKSSRFRASDYDNLKSWQRLNHYPKATGITRKDCLARNLKRMKAVYGSIVYNFCPLSFNLPNDYTKFVAEYTKLKPKSEGKKSLWICKPIDMSRGRGIFIFKDLSELQYDRSAVVQKYITNPMLISGYKFDLRIYVAVSSFHPLRIYVHQESIVRFSTEKYDLTSLNNIFSHLTNSSINKHSPNYSADKERIGPGCKWTLTQLRYYFHQNNIDDRLLWQRIINIITLTLITQSPLVPKVENCFELYGFDILVDENKKPWLVEVNFSPSLSADCQIDYLVKKPVLHDMFELLNFKDVDMDHGKVSDVQGKKTSHQRSSSRLSRANSVQKHLPQVPLVNPKQSTPLPSANESRPIFGLPLVPTCLSDDEGCVLASGDSAEDKETSLKLTRSREKTIHREPSLDRLSHTTPRTPRSRYGLRKINSKSSSISDSGISSFSGHSENSSAVLPERSDLSNERLKPNPTKLIDMKSLCNINSASADVNNWRFMVRKQISTPEKLEKEEKASNSKENLLSVENRRLSISKVKRKTHLSVTDTQHLSPPPNEQKRHSISGTRSWLQTSRSRLINQHQVGHRGPAKKYGDFFLVFPFNDATLRASQTSLDARVIIREIQKQMRDVATNGGSPDRLWYSVRPTKETS